MDDTRHPPTNQAERDQMEQYAALRFFGLSQTKAAERIGISPSTGRKWERCDWWRPLIVDTVERKHVSKLVWLSRRVIEKTIKLGLKPDEEITSKDRKLAFDAAKWLIERQDSTFAGHSEAKEQVTGRKLGDLSVQELRALARMTEDQMMERIRNERYELPSANQGAISSEVVPGFHPDDES